MGRMIGGASCLPEPITDLYPQADKVSLGPATADHTPEPGESASRVAGPQVPACTWEESGVVEEDGALSVTAWPFPVSRSPVLCPRVMPGTRKLSMKRGRLYFGVLKKN